MGHGVPVLPHSDPGSPVAKPSLHLEVEPHNDEAVRAQIIAEEEAKDAFVAEEPQINNEVVPEESKPLVETVQEPINGQNVDNREFFYAKQEQYKQNSKFEGSGNFHLQLTKLYLLDCCQ